MFQMLKSELKKQDERLQRLEQAVPGGPIQTQAASPQTPQKAHAAEVKESKVEPLRTYDEIIRDEYIQRSNERHSRRLSAPWEHQPLRLSFTPSHPAAFDPPMSPFAPARNSFGPGFGFR